MYLLGEQISLGKIVSGGYAAPNRVYRFILRLIISHSQNVWGFERVNLQLEGEAGLAPLGDNRR